MELRRTIEPEKNIILRGSVKEEPATKKITEKRLKWYGRVERRDEGHILRIMLHENQERDGEEHRKPGEKTCVQYVESVWLSGILISNTVLANPNDGKNTEKKKNGRCIFIT